MKSLLIGIHLERGDIHVEAIPFGELWLSGVTIADDQPLADRDLLLRVAKLRGELLERATFIAIRYGSVVPPLPSLRPEWRAILTANRENVEMTLKVVSASPKERPSREQFTKGADYLKALHESANVEIASDFRHAAERAMNGVASRWIRRDEKSIELAVLVPRSRVDEIRRSGEQLKSGFPRVPFLLSGPW
ncbi:MAG TPA: GvpL/GvpF family gas vesicle protein, partial [Thermoanaerobaculia bacterium]|nr:GvpL/GvpF family gas vesicle protein [Thermoanaerobaculia bacterium]